MNTFNTKMYDAIKEQSLRKVWEKANKFKDNTDLSLGNPVGLPPKEFIEELINILKSDMDNKFFGYINNAGIIKVRKIIAEDIVKDNLLPKGLTKKNIVMTTGASGAHNCVFKTILNPGDEVIILKPFFPDFPEFVKNNGGVVKYTELKAPDYDLDINAIKKTITKKTKAIIINSPNNPTGQIYSEKKLKQLSKMLNEYEKKRNQTIFLISDEVYRDIVYLPYKFYSPCKYYNNSFMIYSFSKSLFIPGERIGYVAIHPNMKQSDKVFEILKLSNRILGYVNAPSLMQKVLKKVLPIKFDLEDYQYKRDILLEALTRAKLDFTFPKGTFYIMVKIPPNKEQQFFKLLKDYHISVIPSKPFGINGYIRLAYCQNLKTIKDAKKKILAIGKILNE